MTHEPVVSSMIVSIGHDEDTKTLEVRFRGGKTYSYEGVSRDEFEALRDAPSVGQHFNENYRNR